MTRPATAAAISGEPTTVARGYRVVTVEDLAVEVDDVITATVSVSGLAWFFTVPAGVGDLSDRLEITGGSLA